MKRHGRRTHLRNISSCSSSSGNLPWVARRLLEKLAIRSHPPRRKAARATGCAQLASSGRAMVNSHRRWHRVAEEWSCASWTASGLRSSSSKTWRTRRSLRCGCAESEGCTRGLIHRNRHRVGVAAVVGPPCRATPPPSRNSGKSNTHGMAPRTNPTDVAARRRTQRTWPRAV